MSESAAVPPAMRRKSLTRKVSTPRSLRPDRGNFVQPHFHNPCTFAARSACRLQLRKKAWFGAAAVLALARGAHAGFAWAKSRGRARPPRTAVVQNGALDDTVSATGTLQPRDFVDVGPQVSGQVKKLHVEIGDIVDKGRLLAEIGST